MEILELPGVSEWLLTKEGMLQILEYFLWDQFREGISGHCAGVAPCLFVECDQLLAMIKSALGEFFYLETSTMAKYKLEDASVQVSL